MLLFDTTPVIQRPRKVGSKRDVAVLGPVDVGPRIRAVDLFCGGGGSSWGARSAGVEMVGAVDAWETAVETYRRNFPGANVVQATLTERSTPSLLGDVGPIDLLLASPECTNHTCAKGSRPRDEASKETANYVLNFAKELSPRWIVVENVVQMRSWVGYRPLIASLERLGYHVSPQIIDASELGVPQARRRLFLLCDLEREPASVVVTPVGSQPARSVVSFDGPWRSGPLYTTGRAAGTIARAERAIAQLGQGVPFLIVYYGSDGSGGWQPLDRPLRTMTTLDRFGLVWWDGAVPMLRMLQVPELQRAMGFDDQYSLSVGSRRDQVKLLGNGVCPPVMEAVVRTLVHGLQIQDAAE